MLSGRVFSNDERLVISSFRCPHQKIMLTNCMDLPLSVLSTPCINKINLSNTYICKLVYVCLLELHISSSYLQAANSLSSISNHIIYIVGNPL